MIPPELVPFLESGLSTLIGTRDASGLPECLRAVGVRVLPDRACVRVYLPVATAARTVANLRDNGRIALALSMPPTDRTVQLKGQVRALREAVEGDRSELDALFASFVAHLAAVGLPSRVTQRIARWPAWAVDVAVEEIFVQTPGPRAGSRLDERGFE